jgi:hypothetical protein
VLFEQVESGQGAIDLGWGILLRATARAYSDSCRQRGTMSWTLTAVVAPVGQLQTVQRRTTCTGTKKEALQQLGLLVDMCQKKTRKKRTKAPVPEQAANDDSPRRTRHSTGNAPEASVSTCTCTCCTCTCTCCTSTCTSTCTNTCTTPPTPAPAPAPAAPAAPTTTCTTTCTLQLHQHQLHPHHLHQHLHQH